MPINDERRRFGRAKATPDTEPPTAAATGGTPGPKDGVQESLQSLQETLLLQRNERAEFRAEEEKRIQASEEAVRRARDERNEKYERLQQAFERVDRWKDEEKAEAAREQSKRAQDMDGFRLVGEALERYRKQRADARALLETMFRERREERKEVIEMVKSSRSNPGPPERKSRPKTSARRPMI